MTQDSPARRRAFLSAFLALALAVPAFAQDANKDVVRLKEGGKTESGKIKSEEYGGLLITVGKEDKLIPWSDILPDNGISYAGAPQYQSAKDTLDQGKFEEAATTLTEIKGEKGLRAVIKQDVLYYLAVAQQRQGKLDEALGAFKDLLTEFPKSKHLMSVGDNLVAIYLAKKDVAGAMKALEQLSTDAATAGVEAGFGSSISVLKGRVLEEQKKYPEAVAQYTVAEKATGVSANVVSEAVLGEARCAVALNDKTKAEGLFRKLVAQDGPNTVLAGAWNGLGDLMLEEGRKSASGKPDPEKILEALYYFLRGVVQYAPLPGEPTNEYVRSKTQAANCFKFLAQLETKPEARKILNDRAEALLQGPR